MDELILETLKLMHAELVIINKCLTYVEYELASVKEDAEITKTVVFKFVEWADQSSVAFDIFFLLNY